MTYPERKEKEKHLLYLIEQKRLCSIEKVANDYGCSIRTVKRMLENLRNEGKTIVYCRKTSKYFLEE
ncbi:DeoR family transcriptional regulator [uncultured Algibacter sp.]|uniref:DeoR family transcriptional regulator n=1 Tax=uncultured Algibacter sp. TaxID=298659 RepID=UPI00262CDBD4|nr:DeoR family transcriptional regulator [uncultured Algibacter sp.]